MQWSEFWQFFCIYLSFHRMWNFQLHPFTSICLFFYSSRLEWMDFPHLLSLSFFYFCVFFSLLLDLLMNYQDYQDLHWKYSWLIWLGEQPFLTWKIFSFQFYFNLEHFPQLILSNKILVKKLVTIVSFLSRARGWRLLFFLSRRDILSELSFFTWFAGILILDVADLSIYN